MEQFSNRRGLTLIELLVVIIVVGIVAIAIFAAINVTGNLDKANLANAKTFSASVENSLAINQVGKWSFEEQATPGKDTSGYGNNGVLNGGVAWQDANTCGLGFGGCVEFGNGSITIPDAESLEVNENLTISMWIYPTNLAAGKQALIYKGPPPHEYHILMGPDGAIRFFHDDSSPSFEVGLGQPKVQENKWSHVVITRDMSSKMVYAYINGKLVGSNDFPENPTKSTSPVVIGSNPDGTRAFFGRIDEVSIYNETLKL